MTNNKLRGRFAIQFDSTDTATVRKLCVALHKAGLTKTLAIGVEGPECWGGETPKMTAEQYATVVTHLFD